MLCSRGIYIVLHNTFFANFGFPSLSPELYVLIMDLLVFQFPEHFLEDKGHIHNKVQIICGYGLCSGYMGSSDYFEPIYSFWFLWRKKKDIALMYVAVKQMEIEIY